MKGIKEKVFCVFIVFLVFVFFIIVYDLIKGSEKLEDIYNISLLRNSGFFNWFELKKMRGIIMVEEKKVN